MALASTDWLLAQGWRQGLFLHCIDEAADKPLPFGLEEKVGCYRVRDESKRKRRCRRPFYWPPICTPSVLPTKITQFNCALYSRLNAVSQIRLKPVLCVWETAKKAIFLGTFPPLHIFQSPLFHTCRLYPCHSWSVHLCLGHRHICNAANG